MREDVKASAKHSGKLIGIATRPARMAAMERRDAASITVAGGLVGDHAGKRPDRLVTVLAREDWEAALAALIPPLENGGTLEWTTRRANLLVENIRLPRAPGAVLRIGEVVLEITGQTHPCARMEAARKGLLKALAPEWRGGVLCRVAEPGDIRLGDDVEIVSSPPEIERRLP